MGLFSIEVICADCNSRYGVLVEREQRNDPMPCEKCEEGTASRTMSVPNVSTEKLSESLPSSVAAGRFDNLREYSKMQKELRKAQKEYRKNPTPDKSDEVSRLQKEKSKIKGD